MRAIAALLAHEGGWDEILLVGVPIILIVAILAIAKKRVDKINHSDPDDAP